MPAPSSPDSPVQLSQELLDALEEELERVGAPIRQAWAPGLDEAELDKLVAPTGLTLPEEARLWWSWHNGIGEDPQPSHLLGELWTPLPLDKAAVDTVRMRDVGRTMEAENPDFPAAVWQSDWLVLCSDLTRARLAIDCSGTHGPLAPVHHFDPMVEREPARPIVASIGEYVAMLVKAFEDGALQLDDEGWVVRDEPQQNIAYWQANERLLGLT